MDRTTPRVPAGARQVASASPGRAARKRNAHFWVRWIHVYSSMLGLILMLFFGVTGVTLNHPDWGVSNSERTSDSTGVLPAETVQGFAEGTEVLIAVSEYARSDLGVSGDVVDFNLEQSDGSISYRAPGYAADLFFDSNGDYRLTTRQAGIVGIMNALHAGRDADSGWKLLIDVSGVLLTVIAVTGIGIQLFMRKRRKTALGVMAAGAVLTVLLIIIALP